MSTSTPAGPVRILHLSDIHFRSGKTWDSDPVLRHLVRFLAREAAQGLAPDLVAVTGDLAFSGRAEEYDLAQDWLSRALWPALSPHGSMPLPPERLLLVPGNHDVDRSRVSDLARMAQDGLLDRADQERIASVMGDAKQCALLAERHAAYLDFQGAWLGQHQTVPWCQRAIEIRGQRLHIAGLDSAWMACGDTDRGRLLLGRWQIHKTVDTVEAEGADWRLALLHHPWDYLAEFDAVESRQAVLLHRDLVLRGHLHEGEASLVRPPDPARACLELAAGCTYDGSRYPNAFHWIELYPEAKRVRVLFRIWNRGVWQVDRNRPGCPGGVAEISMGPLEPAPGSRRGRRGNASGANHPPAESSAMADNSIKKAPVQRESALRRGRCDVLLLYVNDKERAAIATTFVGPRGRLPKPRTIQGLSTLDLGSIKGRRVFAMGTNMGSTTPGGSATVVLDAIKKLDPEWIIAVGVAFGMDADKTPVGTILVSDRVSCYESQRVGRTETISRGDTVSVHPYLKQYFQTVSGPPHWTGQKVRFGEILSGEKLIDQQGFKGKLRKAYPEAIGGEMEAAGIYSAAMLEQCAWIVVKAVCDFADGSKGEDKDARQAIAAGNAASFVRHCLTAYLSTVTPRSSLDDGRPRPAFAKPEKAHPEEGRPSSRQRQDPTREDLLTSGSATHIHRTAIREIAARLDAESALLAALAEHPMAPRGADAEGIATWLCHRATKPLRSSMAALRRGVRAAAGNLRRAQGDLAALRADSRDILGWMSVVTVLDDYGSPDAPEVQNRWFDEAAYYIPLGRNACIEVLSARWANRKADFETDRNRWDYGPDDISPHPKADPGLNDPLRMAPELAVKYVRGLIYKAIEGKEPPANLDDDTWEEVRKRVEIQLAEIGRQRRLVLDGRGSANAFSYRAVLTAIQKDIPKVNLIVLVDRREGDPEIFLLPSAELSANIKETLDAIEAIV